MSALSLDLVQLTANGSTASTNVPLDGDYSFYAYGSFGSGTITFQASHDSTNWFTLSTATANTRVSHKLTAGEFVRATLSGAIAPTVDVSIR